MSVLRKAFFVVLFIGLVSHAALGDDYNPPTWRGEAGSTFQQWEFSTNMNPSAPEVVMNPYGDPLATVVFDAMWLPWKSIDQEHHGVWVIEDYLQLDLPNTDTPNPFKEIWLQLTYYADGSGDPEFWAPVGAPYNLSSVQLLDKTPVDAYYTHATYLLILEPNPIGSEILYITPRDCTLYLDEVVVDTRCVPEPASLACLLPVCAWLCRRRRR